MAQQPQPQSSAQPPVPVPSAAAAVQAGDTRPIHIYIRAGLKSHGEGAHDYPQFIADWSKLLTDKGALVDGSFHFPTAQELATTDVMVMYKGDAGYMTATERAVLEDYLKRGGGLVSFHDTLCGDDPQYYSTIVGGAEEARRAELLVGRDQVHHRRQGVADHEGHVGLRDQRRGVLQDHLGAESRDQGPRHGADARRRARSCRRCGPTSARSSAASRSRSFVWMQGHTYTNFKKPQIEAMLLRGIAWAAHYPVDTLVNGSAPPRGGGRGRGRGGLQAPAL